MTTVMIYRRGRLNREAREELEYLKNLTTEITESIEIYQWFLSCIRLGN